MKENNIFLGNERIGATNVNKYGSTMIVESYTSALDISVRFLEYGNLEHTSWRNFFDGKVKNPYDKILYNVGFTGVGLYLPTENKKNTPQYQKWVNMLERCYNKKSIKRRPAYNGVTVCEEWHNFQNFAAWYDENYYEVEGEIMCLDKDILIKGNKVYSPETCVFVPHSINLLFGTNKSKRGQLPIGVSLDGRSNKYRVQCYNQGDRMSVHCFNSPEDAFNYYKIYKENVIKQTAKEYRSKIPDSLYQALINYIIEITD